MTSLLHRELAALRAEVGEAVGILRTVEAEIGCRTDDFPFYDRLCDFLAKLDAANHDKELRRMLDNSKEIKL